MENEDSIKIPEEVRAAMKTEGTTPNKTETTQARQADTTAFQQQTDAVQKTEYPSEVVDLPSKGWFYDQTSPLASGRVDVKYMTAKEEDILTSQNLIKKGIVLDKLLEQLIITPGVKLDDILVGDKNAIFIAARVLAYGKDYKIKFKDPSTGDDVEAVSYTHLRAHETSQDLVCRLLLEKKKEASHTACCSGSE